MASEVLRKLIDGVWRTVVADAADSGGSQPSATDGAGVTIPAVSQFMVTPGALTDEGGGVAGIVVQTRLLGPFSVAFDDTNLLDPANNGALITAIPANAVVHAFAVATVEWLGDGVPQMFLVLGTAVGSPSTNLAVYALNQGLPNGAPSGLFAEMPLFPDQIASARNLGRPTVDCNLYAAVYSDASTVSAGEADIYALIATPLT